MNSQGCEYPTSYGRFTCLNRAVKIVGDRLYCEGHAAKVQYNRELAATGYFGVPKIPFNGQETSA